MEIPLHVSTHSIVLQRLPDKKQVSPPFEAAVSNMECAKKEVYLSSEKTVMASNITRLLSDDTFQEIFKSFPAYELLQIKNVCQDWKSIIDDGIFSKTQNAYQSSLVTSKSVLTLDSDGIFFEILKYGDSNQVVAKKCKKQFEGPYNYINATCNGLIFMVLDLWDWNLSSNKKKIGNSFVDFDLCYLIFNPLLGPTNAIEIPHPLTLRIGEPNYEESNYHFGFGYIRSRDDFYVVAISLPKDYEIIVYLYSLRSGHWDTYQGTLLVADVKEPLFFNSYLNWYGPSGTFINDSLHWILSAEDQRKCDENYVLAFNLANPELAKLIPLPPFFRAKEGRADLSVYCKLSSIDNELCSWAETSVVGGDKIGELWIMKDYAKAWTKLFVMDQYNFGCLDFFGRTNAGLFLIHRKPNEVIVGDLLGNPVKFSEAILKSKRSVVDYVPSLVSVLSIISDRKNQ